MLGALAALDDGEEDDDEEDENDANGDADGDDDGAPLDLRVHVGG